MIMGTLGHLLSLRMQSIVGNVNLLAWNFNGFKVCWIQPFWIQVLLDSTYGGFRVIHPMAIFAFKLLLGLH